MIRFANAADLEQVQHLRKEVNDLHVQGRPDFFKAGFGRELQDYIYAYMVSEKNQIVVDEEDGTICGMVMVDWIERPETPYAPARKMCHIAEICVDASCRGTGIGHALLEFVRQEARKRGFPRIELDVWDFNDALGFYEKEGFKVYRRFLEQEV